jgi:hypothetical protein
MLLKTWQKENNITDEKLAKLVKANAKTAKVKVRCSGSMISHFNRGRKNFSSPVALIIGDITGINLRELINNKAGAGQP